MSNLSITVHAVLATSNVQLFAGVLVIRHRCRPSFFISRFVHFVPARIVTATIYPMLQANYTVTPTITANKTDNASPRLRLGGVTKLAPPVWLGCAAAPLTPELESEGAGASTVTTCGAAVESALTRVLVAEVEVAFGKADNAVGRVPLFKPSVRLPLGMGGREFDAEAEEPAALPVLDPWASEPASAANPIEGGLKR